MPQPVFFSVVIAVRNGEKYIAKTLESILNQTYPNFDVIVVDDRSTDQTTAIVNHYCQQDYRLKLISNSFGVGPCHARNCGIAQAQGNWIAICDADDLWQSEKLQIQADFIENWHDSEPLVALGSAAHLINEKDKLISFLGAFPTTLAEFKQRRESCEPFMLHHASTVFNKDVFWQIGGYRVDYAIGAEDCDLFTRFADVGVVLNINQPLFQYRKHRSSSMLKNTIAQFNDVERIKENTIRRRNGLEELSHEQFLEQLDQKLTQAEKHTRLRLQRGKFLYRMGAINIANGRYLSGSYHLVLAMFCDHALVMNGIKNATKFLVFSSKGSTDKSEQASPS